MRKKIILSCCLTLFLFATVSICYAYDFKAVKELKRHPEFVSIEGCWGTKLGTDYRIKLTNDRILEFQYVDAINGGGKFASLRVIDEFELGGSVLYVKPSWNDWKYYYGTYARLQDLSHAIGIKIETMVDVINHYNEILAFVKMIANEQYTSNDYLYHVDSENRQATIWVEKIHGYYNGLWHGVKEDGIPFDAADWGESLCIRCYGKNWREKLNADLPKIRKSLGLE